MLNVHELENRHKKYKLKSYTPYLIILLSITIALVSISFFTLNYFNSIYKSKNEAAEQKEVYTKNLETKSTVEEKSENISVPIEEKKRIEVQKKQEKILLSPSLDFIKSMESQTQMYKKENENFKTTEITEKKMQEAAKKVKEPVKKIQERKEEIVLPKIEEVKESITVAKETSTIDIKRRDEETDIKHVIKRFNVNHSPALSLFIAKKYYQLENYEQAYNYALATNELNNDIEASWIIFSKSLVKLGKKEMAIETLKKYIKHSSSSQAKQLLDEILSGKFK